MISCLMSFARDEDDVYYDLRESEVWVNAVDRGGLCHISDITLCSLW